MGLGHPREPRNAALNCSSRNKQLGPMPPQRLSPNTANNRYSRHLPPRTCALRTRYGTGYVLAGTRHSQVHMLQGQTLPRNPSATPILSHRPIAPHSSKTRNTPSNAQQTPPTHGATHRPTRGYHPPFIPRGWPTLTPTRGITGTPSSRALELPTLRRPPRPPRTSLARDPTDSRLAMAEPQPSG